MTYTPGGIVAALLPFGDEASNAHIRKAAEIRKRAELDANPRADGRHVSAWYEVGEKDSLPWPMFTSAPESYYKGREDARSDLAFKHFASWRKYKGWELRAYRRGWATERANTTPRCSLCNEPHGAKFVCKEMEL